MLRRNLLITLFSLTSLISTTSYAFSTKNGAIYDGNGNIVNIDGVAWIGFQDSNFIGGLWNVPFNPIGSQNGVIELMKTPWTVPGSNISSSSKGVAFKSIRLPIQPGLWHNATTVQNSPFSFQPTNIATPAAGNGPFCDWSAGADASGHCIRSLGAADLLTATINQFLAQNMYVMLDFHHRPGLGDNFRDGTVVAADYTLKTYYQDLVNFAKTAPSNVLGIDIYNEPHNLYWFQSNTTTSPAQPAWISVIAAAASAAYSANKNLLIFVEAPGGTTANNEPYDPISSSSKAICMPAGTKIDNTANISLGNSSLCAKAPNTLRANYIASNWGENFRALLDTAQSANGVAKFNVVFFRSQLIAAIQANAFDGNSATAVADWLLGANNDGNGGHLVFAPHVYGAEVGGWQTDANDSTIRFKWNFGFLMDSGFPFIIGEIGFSTQMPATGGEDFFVNSITPYLVSKGINHNLFFWTWNYADSPPGIRASDSNYSLLAYKEQDLYNLFNATAPVQTTGTLCVTVPTAPAGYTGSTMPIITATGTTAYTFALTAFASKLCQSSVLTGNYTLTGSVLSNTDGTQFIPSQSVTATVTKNTQTDATVQYVKAPEGTLQVNVTGGTNCPIPANQTFTVTYASGQSSKQLIVTGGTPVSTKLQVGSYTISVAPATLPASSNCNAKYTNSVNITAGTTTQETINYVYSSPAACSISASCSTWGTPSDSWAGSSCNFNINMKTAMTNPTVITMPVSGISSLSGIWNATGSLKGGNVVLTLGDAVYTPSFGFNANGIISLPSSATLVTNGATYACSVTH